MSIKGGYKIIDFKNTAITTDGATAVATIITVAYTDTVTVSTAAITLEQE